MVNILAKIYVVVTTLKNIKCVYCTNTTPIAYDNPSMNNGLPTYDEATLPTYEQVIEHNNKQKLTDEEIKTTFVVNYMNREDKYFVKTLRYMFENASFDENFLIPNAEIANDENVLEFLNLVKKPYQKAIERYRTVKSYKKRIHHVDLEIVPSIDTYEITDKTKLTKRIEIIKYIKKANFQVLLAIYNSECNQYKSFKDMAFITDYYNRSLLFKEKLLGNEIIRKLMLETELVVKKIKEYNDRQYIKNIGFSDVICYIFV
ncbi:hypothetical protein BDAP_002111 [Binucleata daphniae]